MPGGPEAEQPSGEVIVARVTRVGIDELAAIPQGQERRQRVRGLVMLQWLAAGALTVRLARARGAGYLMAAIT
jgi:hypothetical protein